MWVIYATLAACCFGLRGILYGYTSRKGLERHPLLFGVYMTGTLIAILLTFLFHQHFTWAALGGMIMGVTSFTANSAMYRGFAAGKASILAILVGLPPIVSAAMAFLLWGERLQSIQLLAFVLIILGILLIRFSGDLSMENLKGVQWGLIAMLFFGLTDTSSKQTMLWHAGIFPVLFMMFGTGSCLFGGLCLLDALRSGQRMRAAAGSASPVSSGKPSADGEDSAHADRVPGSSGYSAVRPDVSPQSFGRTFLTGMAVGISNISGMTLILPAFAGGITGLVSAVVSTNVLFVLLYARFFLMEKFNRRELMGMAMAFCGLMMLHLWK